MSQYTGSTPTVSRNPKKGSYPLHSKIAVSSSRDQSKAVEVPKPQPTTSAYNQRSNYFQQQRRPYYQENQRPAHGVVKQHKQLSPQEKDLAINSALQQKTCDYQQYIRQTSLEQIRRKAEQSSDYSQKTKRIPRQGDVYYNEQYQQHQHNSMNQQKQQQHPHSVTIAKKLEELNKWQEIQKQRLEQRQNQQRKLLDIEQRSAYKLLCMREPETQIERFAGGGGNHLAQGHKYGAAVVEINKQPLIYDRKNTKKDVEGVLDETETSVEPSEDGGEIEDFNNNSANKDYYDSQNGNNYDEEDDNATITQDIDLEDDTETEETSTLDIDADEEIDEEPEQNVRFKKLRNIKRTSMASDNSTAYKMFTSDSDQKPLDIVNNARREANVVNVLTEKPVKRQFLRRGEGLKQRFGIDPEELRLNNLPPYKFANTHINQKYPYRYGNTVKSQKAQVSQNSVSKKAVTKNHPTVDTNAVANSSSVITLKKITKSPTAVLVPVQPTPPPPPPPLPVEEQMENLSNYKTEPLPLPTTFLESQEHKFQRLLFTSEKVCNSTPEIRSIATFNKHQNLQPRNKHVVSSDCAMKLTPLNGAKRQRGGRSRTLSPQPQSNASERKIKAENVKPSVSVSWTKISQVKTPFVSTSANAVGEPGRYHKSPIYLTPINSNSSNRKTISYNDFKEFNQTDDDIFEMLEKQAQDGTIDMNSSFVKKFIERRNRRGNVTSKDVLDEEDDIPVTEDLRNKPLQPVVVNEKFDDHCYQQQQFEQQQQMEQNQSNLVESSGVEADTDEFISQSEEVDTDECELSLKKMITETSATNSQDANIATLTNKRNNAHVRFIEPEAINNVHDTTEESIDLQIHAFDEQQAGDGRRILSRQEGGGQVYFSDYNQQQEYEEPPEQHQNSQVYQEQQISPRTPTNDKMKSDNNEFFHLFKEALFNALQLKVTDEQEISEIDDNVNSMEGKVTCDSGNYGNPNEIDFSMQTRGTPLITETVRQATKELQDKTEMVKLRLSELEREIATFKENNLELLKVKQQLEMEKTVHAQDKLDLEEKLKNERIQMEIYLHDERMKLEDEKRAFEQQFRIKNQNAGNKERKEIARLREQVTHLEAQLKSKENTHITAQARLRSQLRNLEREQKKLHEEIERITKDNKRLESENLKISRQQNTKLLQEINRNIAKLAPKVSELITCGNDVQQPTSTTTLTSTTAAFDDGTGTIMSPSVSKTIVATAVANRNYNTMRNIPMTSVTNSSGKSIQQYSQHHSNLQQQKSDLKHQSQPYLVQSPPQQFVLLPSQQDLQREIRQYPQDTQNQQKLYQNSPNCYEAAQQANKKSNTTPTARKSVHWHEVISNDNQQPLNQPTIGSAMDPLFERSSGGTITTNMTDNVDEMNPVTFSNSTLKEKFYQSPQPSPTKLQQTQVQAINMNNNTDYYDEMDEEIMQELQIDTSFYHNKKMFKMPDKSCLKTSEMARFYPLPANVDDIKQPQQFEQISQQQPKQQLSPKENYQQKQNIMDNIGKNQMKREMINPDGSRDIWYANGNQKKISANGMVIRMLYFNKDIKETNINEGTVKYYYANTNTWHTTYLDGLEVIEFPSGQVEHHHANGMIEIHYPNNSVKFINLPEQQEKLEEWRFADGSTVIQKRNGDRILIMPNGQKEIHSKDTKRREYPDGTVKIVYSDGRQETRYSNGRVRLKDKDGKLIIDSMAPSEERTN